MIFLHLKFTLITEAIYIGKHEIFVAFVFLTSALIILICDEKHIKGGAATIETTTTIPEVISVLNEVEIYQSEGGEHEVNKGKRR